MRMKEEKRRSCKEHIAQTQLELLLVEVIL